MYEDKRLHKLKEHRSRVRKKERIERRKQERFRTGDNFLVKINSIDAVLKDIGYGGVCLKTSKRLSIGSVFEIKMASPDKHEIVPTGIVVWLLLVKNGTKKNEKSSHYEAGLKFIKLSLKDTAFIDSINNNV